MVGLIGVTWLVGGGVMNWDDKLGKTQHFTNYIITILFIPGEEAEILVLQEIPFKDTSDQR